MIRVEECTEVDDELVTAIAGLVPQLSSSSPPPTGEDLEEIVRSAATHLLVARDADWSGSILGAMTLVVFRIPTGVRAWIEDVVVDGEARGRGVGEALNRAALDIARQRGARTVDLTSRPTREAANRLYRRIGFVERDTNVYRFSLES
jgi:ribosomal protein S18 acetylase RimI-like enzyme